MLHKTHALEVLPENVSVEITVRLKLITLPVNIPSINAAIKP